MPVSAAEPDRKRKVSDGLLSAAFDSVEILLTDRALKFVKQYVQRPE